jgi:hypothetical protein
MAPQKEKTAEDVFAEFGVGTGDVAMRKFIRGQRKLNKRFYKTMEAILDHLKKGQDQKRPDQALLKAEKLNDGVPGDGPGCGGN